MTLSGLLMAPVEVSSFPAPRPRRCGVFARRANADDAIATHEGRLDDLEDGTGRAEHWLLLLRLWLQVLL